MTAVTGTAAKPYKVFVAGGCYSGLSAAIHLIERCDSRTDNPIHVSVTIVDERDGFCMLPYPDHEIASHVELEIKM